MKASDVFLKAAEVLRTRGHCKFILEDCDGKLCVAGAIQVASLGYADPWREDSYPLLRQVTDVLGREAVDWNNDRLRKPEEVIAALDAAAVVALQEEGIEPEDVL